MNDAVIQLAQARQEVDGYEDNLAILEEQFHESPLWVRMETQRENLREAKDRLAVIDAGVRAKMLTAYTDSGDKAPHPAIKIKMFTVLEYDVAEALDYAREHLPGALNLAKRKFEKAAKAIELDFVTVQQEPRVTIARDLSKYLLDEGD